MNRQVFSLEKDGFVGAYYGGPKDSRKAVILMLGDSSTDRMARCGAGWLIANGCHALCMSADKKDYGHHNYPLERFGKAIAFLKSRGMQKIGIAGASTTGMLALTAASFYPEITLTIAMSPSLLYQASRREPYRSASSDASTGESPAFSFLRISHSEAERTSSRFLSMTMTAV